jgi:hypothetical protein
MDEITGAVTKFRGDRKPEALINALIASAHKALD